MMSNYTHLKIKLSFTTRTCSFQLTALFYLKGQFIAIQEPFPYHQWRIRIHLLHGIAETFVLDTFHLGINTQACTLVTCTNGGVSAVREHVIFERLGSVP